MPLKTDSEIETLAQRFLDRTLPKSEWTHEAHFAVALYLLDTDTEAAFANMPTYIRAYNEATGVENTGTSGYHETITLASLHAAKLFRQIEIPEKALHSRLEALLLGPYGQSDWLLKHWSRERLFSAEARRKWVEPDLEPLSFPTKPDQE